MTGVDVYNEIKRAWPDRCTRDTPRGSGKFPAIYSKILSGCGKEPPRRRADADCDEDTPIDDDAPYSVTLTFWKSSEVDGTEIPDTEPLTSNEFTWTEPDDCFVWWREVDETGEMRMNVMTALSLEVGDDGEVKFAYAQNSWTCCTEF